MRNKPLLKCLTTGESRGMGYCLCCPPPREPSGGWGYLAFAVMLAMTISFALPGCTELARAPRPYRAVDGDTIKVGEGVNRSTIRLLRIDAPELPGHSCKAGGRLSCIDSDPVRAGAAKQFLQDKLEHYDLICKDGDDGGREHDKYGRRLAECTLGLSNNLSDTLLLSGLVDPYREKE